MYKLNLTTNHALSLLGLINYDNAATIVTPLTLDEVSLEHIGFTPEDRAIVKVAKKSYTVDSVEVNYTKLNLGDFVVMDGSGEDQGDFAWYKPDEWDDETHPALAVEAFKVAAIRAGIDPDAAFQGGITATRTFDAEANRYFLNFAVSSYVWHEAVSFPMPKHFSEVVTVQDLNGFYFEPIAAEAVVE